MTFTANPNAGWIVPDWPAPARVRAFVTTRAGGVSRAPYDSFNLGTRCGDDAAAVMANRAALRNYLPGEPAWLRQVHGAVAVDAARIAPGEPEADASFTHASGIVCAVLAADCMPVLLADRSGRAVAVAHAGWRGMSTGVIEAAVEGMEGTGVAAGELIAWLGPAIGPERFEVGDDVREAFILTAAGAAAAFQPFPGRPGKWRCDLYGLARLRLAALGVKAVYGGGYCTVNEARFFSYRRDQATGRMGAFIWLGPG